jgi:hypothetical protein
MRERASQSNEEGARPAVRRFGRTAPMLGALALVLVIVASGGATASGPSAGNHSGGVGGATAGDPTLATLPGVTSIAVSPTEMFAVTTANCTQVWAVSPAGVVSLYAVLPIPVAKCGEGSVALAPACWGSIVASGNLWGADVYQRGQGQWGANGGGGCSCGYGNGQSGQDSVWVVQEGQLFEISNHGSTVTSFASFTKEGGDMGLTYDSTGSFGHDLIVTGSSGRVWTVNQTGGVTLVANLHLHIEGPAVAPWGFGSDGGYLFVAAQGKDTVYAIAPDGSFAAFTSWTSAESVAFPSYCQCGFGEGRGVFFVANVTSGTIEAFPASYFTTLKGLGFVDGESNGGIGSFTSSGTTATLASHTRHLEQIAFVQCFGDQGCCGNGGNNYGGYGGYGEYNHGW